MNLTQNINHTRCAPIVAFILENQFKLDWTKIICIKNICAYFVLRIWQNLDIVSNSKWSLIKSISKLHNWIYRNELHNTFMQVLNRIFITKNYFPPEFLFPRSKKGMSYCYRTKIKPENCFIFPGYNNSFTIAFFYTVR